MKILVTGGAGYIGSHTCKALAEAGHEPISYDDMSMGNYWAVRWGPLVVGRISDEASLLRVFEQHSIEAIIHFAGSAYVGESMSDPMKYFVNNTVETMALLNAMMLYGVSKIVFSSTCATYGTPVQMPVTETTPTCPLNPYGESKLMIENTLRWIGKLKDLRWVAFRYFNAAGADPGGLIGEHHVPETHLIPLVLRAAAQSGDPLYIYGADYPTRDGTAIRDYIHVSDLAAAHVIGLNALKNESINDVFNLGTGLGTSVRDIISAVEAVTRSKVPYKVTARRLGDPPELVACSKKAQLKFGWSPVRSDIETIISDAWNWHKKFPALTS